MIRAKSAAGIDPPAGRQLNCSLGQVAAEQIGGAGQGAAPDRDAEPAQGLAHGIG